MLDYCTNPTISLCLMEPAFQAKAMQVEEQPLLLHVEERALNACFDLLCID